MENIIDSIDNAYREFVNDMSSFLEAKESCPSSDSALESLVHKWETFKHACDRAEEFVNHEKQRIACKCTVDDAIAESIGNEFAEDDSTTTFEEAKVDGGGDDMSVELRDDE